MENELKNGSLSIVNVSPKPNKIDYGIITLKNNINTPICRKFIDQIKTANY